MEAHSLVQVGSSFPFSPLRSPCLIELTPPLPAKAGGTGRLKVGDTAVKES